MVVLAALAVAALAAITGLRITAVVLDETVYKFAAQQYAEGVIGGLVDDNTSRGIARLYSLVITPIFVVFDGDVAVRLARALNGVFFAATALPVFALARRAGASVGWASVAGAFSVAVPWLTLATILFSESLAYLLFACVLLAMVRAVEAPSRGREVVVLALLAALVLTRVQFAAVVVAWVAYLAMSEWRAGRRPWKAFPLTFALVLLVLIAVLVRPRSLAGPYYGITQRNAVPGDFGIGLLWEVKMLALGVGVVPALLAVSWLSDAFSRASDVAVGARRVAVINVVAVAAVWAGTLWAQGGWLDFRSEERYFIYTVPVLWIGAVLAIQRGTVRAGWLLWAGVVLAAIVTAVPVQVAASGEQLFLGPVSAVLADVLPELTTAFDDLLGTENLVSARDLTALGVLVVTALAALLWRRGARSAVLVVAVVVQLGFVAYAFAGLNGAIGGFGGLTGGASFADRGWVDRSPAGNDVTLLDNQTRDREQLQRDTVFWNDEVQQYFRLPSLGQPLPAFPLFTLPTTTADVSPELLLTQPMPEGPVVTAVDSPLFQPSGGRVVKTSRDGRLALVEGVQTKALRWLATGLDFDGHVTRPVILRTAAGRRVEIDLEAPRTNQPAAVDVSFGDQKVRFSREQGTATARFDLCDTTTVQRGQIDLRAGGDIGSNRFSGAIVRAVRLIPC